MPYSILDVYAAERAQYGGDLDFSQDTEFASAEQIRVLRAIGVEPEQSPSHSVDEWHYERSPVSEFPDDLDAIMADRAEM